MDNCERVLQLITRTNYIPVRVQDYKHDKRVFFIECQHMPKPHHLNKARRKLERAGVEWWGASHLWGKTYGFYLGVPATT